MHDASIKAVTSPHPFEWQQSCASQQDVLGSKRNSTALGARSVSGFGFIFGERALACVTQMVNRVLMELRLQKRSAEMLKGLSVRGA